VEGLKLGYKGSKGYLSQEEKEQVLSWLGSKDYWNLNELECYISEQFGVAFVAKSSYYDLFHEAGISWKKSQKINPYKDSEKVELKKEEICKWLEQHRDKIERGELEVYFVDECHLSWGDSCGYVWGKTNLRIEIPIKNEREKQTYYGGASQLSIKQRYSSTLNCLSKHNAA
jgi:putative transposase